MNCTVDERKWTDKYGHMSADRSPNSCEEFLGVTHGAPVQTAQGGAEWTTAGVRDEGNVWWVGTRVIAAGLLLFLSLFLTAISGLAFTQFTFLGVSRESDSAMKPTLISVDHEKMSITLSRCILIVTGKVVGAAPTWTEQHNFDIKVSKAGDARHRLSKYWVSAFGKGSDAYRVDFGVINSYRVLPGMW
ncbi:hypothetical protein C8F04DRAFT_1237423 [Mycena alexandri]|uniref:Uncharacterized protein n=1 Tax=Mycena alexandri TaxID=1745969 RepID=A0AAD6SKX4_9AGAR|nr:hypothetical protein C8F04DRAFT_1237423 [Mycena alexandri]